MQLDSNSGLRMSPGQQSGVFTCSSLWGGVRYSPELSLVAFNARQKEDEVVVGVSRSKRCRRLLPVAVALLVVAAVASAASAARTASTAGTPKPATAAAWNKLVAQAKAEGKVVIYSVQNPAGLQDLANAFKAKYGISVTVNRNVDSVLQSQIGAEES